MDNLYRVARFVGRQVRRIRRVFFTHGGATERGVGPIELTFAPAETLLLDVGADGETQAVPEQPWRDPSEPPLSEQNQAWIVEHGQWIAIDVSDEPAYKPLIGATLDSINALRASGGNVCGLRLRFDSRVVDFVDSADEALVFLVEQSDLNLAEMKVYVAEEIRRTSK